MAGFTKKPDIGYFLREICKAEYVHEPLLAPTEEMLKAYRAGAMPWQDYEVNFLALLAERSVENKVSKSTLADAVLLCSEPTPERCHRRLVIEYLSRKWGDVDVTHL